MSSKLSETNYQEVPTSLNRPAKRNAVAYQYSTIIRLDIAGAIRLTFLAFIRF